MCCDFTTHLLENNNNFVSMGPKNGTYGTWYVFVVYCYVAFECIVMKSATHQCGGKCKVWGSF